jgi:hypothetical protein
MTAPSLSERATRAREQLGALAAAGARAFAPSAYAFAEWLVVRGEELGGSAGARLVARAETRGEALARELGEAQARARAALEVVGDASGDGAKAIEAGDTGTFLRAERRHRIVGTPSTARRDEWMSRLAAEARARDIGLGRNVVPSPEAIASALYASSRAELSAALVAIHAEADVPRDAGPYNALAIAARALAELSTLAPGYLTAMVAYLDELSPLLALPAAGMPTRERPRASRMHSSGKGQRRPSR